MLLCVSFLITHLLPHHTDFPVVKERDLVHISRVMGRGLIANRISRTIQAKIRGRRQAVGHPQKGGG